jgi:hypothetical protein
MENLNFKDVFFGKENTIKSHHGGCNNQNTPFIWHYEKKKLKQEKVINAIIIIISLSVFLERCTHNFNR